MNSVCPPLVHSGCPLRVVCRCLQVTESEVVEAVTAHDLRSVKDICHHTGAGDGCTACHAHLRAILEHVTLADIVRCELPDVVGALTAEAAAWESPPLNSDRTG